MVLRLTTERLVALVAAIFVAGGGSVYTKQPQEVARPSVPARVSALDARALLDQYCVSCHNAQRLQAGLALDQVDFGDVPGHAATLEKVVRKLRLGAMPPTGMRRPAPDAHRALVDWLEGELDRAALARPTPGPSEALHRLNRTEYQNAIHDVLGIEGVDVATMLPADDASYGFDNIAGILGVSPTHLDQYLAAARKISRIAVGDVTLPPSSDTYRVTDELSQDRHLEGMPFGTRGGLRMRRYFPVDAEYWFRFQSVPGVGRSFDEPNTIELSIDGRRVFVAAVVQKEPMLTSGDDRDANTDYEVRLPVKAGVHDITVAYVMTSLGETEELLLPYRKPPVGAYRLSRVGGFNGPSVSLASIVGPFAPTGASDSPSRRRIFICQPTQVAEEPRCARTILQTVARRAYRRPPTETDLTRLMAFYEQGVRDGFDAGIQVALQFMLVNPSFLFRASEPPAHAAPGRPYRIPDLELASRLSFFLWSSVPDDALLNAAIRGALHEPVELERQVRRMLADPRSRALVDNFAGQWLRLRNVMGSSPDPHLFPDFDDSLRRAFRRETELFFGSIVAEDRSVLELLSANYTFLNERLARHYGITNVQGSHFRRVALDKNAVRGGLFGQGSILMVTSHADRTSPVNRGKWILENIIGAPPPAPPPDVPLLEATQLQGTMRQKMEQHRKNPVCASCHKAMDPLGFALENLDAVGEWRAEDAGLPVDAEGSLPDGQVFSGVAGLRAALLGQSDVFVTTLAEQLMTYALGRGVDHRDAPFVRAIVRESRRGGYRFSSLVLGIAKSVPFQMRTIESASDTATNSGIEPGSDTAKRSGVEPGSDTAKQSGVRPR